MIAEVLFSLFTAVPAGSPVAWHFGAASTDDGRVLITITAQLEEGWHIYATDLPTEEGPLPTEFRFNSSTNYAVEIPLTEPEPDEAYDPNFAVVVRHHSGTPRYTMLLERLNDARFTVQGEVEYMVCNDRTCLPPVVVPFNIEVGPIEKVRE